MKLKEGVMKGGVLCLNTGKQDLLLYAIFY